MSTEKPLDEIVLGLPHDPLPNSVSLPKGEDIAAFWRRCNDDAASTKKALRIAEEFTREDLQQEFTI